ncbi:MAG: KEOPS complex kinase/ATPase Bud32 [Candidatus Methanomethyliaceae archaeon]|nr:KEOPS complex kinase/ATPase Bud32 [Candidatus Methanomethyliaceae archaeon]
MEKMTLIKKGAEAELYHMIWMGRESVLKRRIKKLYRNPDLDLYIRTTRTSLEAKLLSEARRLGVPTPIVYSLDLKNAEIIMSFISGPPLKKVIPNMDRKSLFETFSLIGSLVGKLHKGGIVHGDLTTSNMILKEDLLFLIDFGLGDHTFDLEARGVDIHLMRRALESSHHEISKFAYDGFISGYEGIMGEETKDVLRRVNEIRRRGRYVEGGR